MGRVAWRLVPLLFIFYIASYIDRVNVGAASLTMKRDLGLSDSVYGFGAGLFFVSYFLCEVPSNLILQRVGARRWIARIMITWGVISMAMALVQGEFSFYVLRFLLGIAEAGFFPGVILYLSYWFPVARRAQMVARFMTAIAIANIVGAPLASWILQLDQVGGWPGWTWLFVIEGLPSIVLGVVVLLLLVDRPRDARFLSLAERTWLEEELERDRLAVAATGRHQLRAAFSDYRVWWLSLLHFAIVFASYGLSLWLAPLIRESGQVTDTQAILLSGIPYILAAVTMLATGWSSDRSEERRWHTAVPLLVAGVGFLAAVISDGRPALLVISLSLAAAGICSALPPFWALPAGFLTGSAAAGGFAVINSLGNLGGFAGSYVMGHFKSVNSFATPLSLLACSLACGAVLAVLFPRIARRGPRAPA